jgi:tRNA U34 5-methylaminomethyl-2-thiouridine-forming methyltransferase MnmC
MLERIVTRDGSITYRNTANNVTYRSLHGAQSESHHVFLRGTRLDKRASPWRVLELGFGTGLNFKVTAQAALLRGVELLYTSLEPNPLPPELWLVPEEWHNIELDRPNKRGAVTLTVHRCKWQDQLFPSNFVEAVYHDPFGPGIAPECWSTECFRWSHRALTEKGVLATFGASTAARRAMQEAGFLVGSEPGAGGKREMTVASKTAHPIAEAKPWKRNPR